TVDRDLERRGHRGLDHLGAGADVDRVDHDLRRRQGRIARDRKRGNRQRARDHGQHRQHRREDRPPDEEVDEHYVPWRWGLETNACPPSRVTASAGTVIPSRERHTIRPRVSCSARSRPSAFSMLALTSTDWVSELTCGDTNDTAPEATTFASSSTSWAAMPVFTSAARSTGTAMLASSTWLS